MGERLLALTDATTPILNKPNDPTKSVMTHLKEEFNRCFSVRNRRKDFFLQAHGPQQFTAYLDKLRNMAINAYLANAWDSSDVEKKNSSSVKTNTVQASPIPGQLAMSLPTRMIKATIAANTASSAGHNLPLVHPAGHVEVSGQIIELDAHQSQSPIFGCD